MDKRADKLKVGDVTKMYGKITKIEIDTSGESYTIYGTKDRATVWKYTLIDLENNKENEVGKTYRLNEMYGSSREKFNRGNLKYSSVKTNASDCADCDGTGKDKKGGKCKECDGTGYGMGS